MIPLRLTVQGLYSYKEPQTIDFETLAGSQLFGIFGAVGSGKSSILEAVVFALYDRSERLNKSGDNRYYNMLNLQSERFAIDFVFQATSPQRTTYRFTVHARRKKKDYEKVEVKERGYYRWENNDWLPIEVPDAASLIGMTYENFMQTVIIPQGKFREFVDQKPNDRTQMLKELFRLEKFDLSHKTNHLLSAVRSSITELEARLSEIGPVTAEAIDVTRQEMREVEIALRQNADLLRQAEVACENYEQLRKLFADRAEAEEQHQALLREQSFYQAKEKQLQAYREAETYFNEKLKTLAATVSEQTRVQEGYQGLLQKIDASRRRGHQAKLEGQQAKEAYDRRETIRGQCADLDHLIRICQLRTAQSALATQEETARLARDKAQESSTAIKEQLKQLECQLNLVVQAQEQRTVLREVAHWCRQHQEYEAEADQKKKQLVGEQRRLNEIDERKRQLLASARWPDESFSTFFTQLDQKAALLHQESCRVRDQLARLRVKAELAHRAQQLTDGEACPLCGAAHHPSVAHPDSVGSAIKQEEQHLARLQEQEKEHDRLSKAMRPLQSEFQNASGKLESVQSQWQAISDKLQAHTATFAWEDYRQQDPAEIIQQAQAHHQQLNQQKAVRQQRTDFQERLNRQEAILAEAQQQWQRAQQAVLAGQVKIDNHRSLLKQLSYEGHQRFTKAQLEDSLSKGQTKLQQVEEHYETTRERQQQAEKKLSVLEAKQEADKILLDSLTARAATINEEVRALCCEKAFDSVDHVKSLIDLELDKEAEQNAIISYKNRLHAAEQSNQKLTEAIRGKRYDAIRHQEAQHTCTHLKEAIEQLQHSWAVAKREVKEQQEKLTKIQQLSRTLREQQLREGNLKELAGLFRGSGFVNYASTVLLEEVCRGANVRFKQLTKNNLSLELNKDNDFIVRDHLNDGRTRLLKTLSGGQTFQAALCLALTLAENIQSLNQANQSFFFLDEGFGSLDKASLRVVFDTLKSLRQENRIVGIISHVEELQQEIDVYLRIEHDRERGSLVKNSWE